VNAKYEELKEKHDDTKDERRDEKVNNARTNTKLQEKLESASSKVMDLTKRLTSSENENNKLLIKLDEKNANHSQKIEVLNDQLITLRLESGEKGSILREKERELEIKNEEIKNLRSQKGQSREELLTEKLHSEKSNLDLFVSRLEISLEQVHGLSKYHERLLVARKNYNQANIDVHEENIARVKQEFSDQGVNIIDIREICQKCERIAEYSWELSQVQQQYQAQQEVPTNH